MSKRVSIFNADSHLDVSGFAPKSKAELPAPSPEQVRAVSQNANFKSREAQPTKAETSTKRPARRYRTGRNVQFNIKAEQEVVDAFYAITDNKDWVLGYTLQRAVEALQRELKSFQ